MNTATLKLIAVGVAGGLLGFAAARIYFSLPPPVQHEEKSTETEESAKPAAEPAEPAKPAEPVEPTKPVQEPAPAAPAPIEQIDTTTPFNNNKFDPILGENNEVIGFMYKIEALKKALTQPSPVLKKIGYQAFPKTRDLLL